MFHVVSRHVQNVPFLIKTGTQDTRGEERRWKLYRTYYNLGRKGGSMTRKEARDMEMSGNCSKSSKTDIR